MKILRLHIDCPSFPASPLPRFSKSLQHTFLQSYSLIVLSLLLSPSLFAQREADNWVFGKWAGLNFTTGDPVPIFIGPGTYIYGTDMSDTIGNLLFMFSHGVVYSKNGGLMQNGTGMMPEHWAWRQGEIAVPIPGSNTKYYLFSVSGTQFPEGLYYSVLDMSLDGGKGAVTSEKNIKIEAATTAQDKLFALKNAAGDGYWIITRLFNDDRYVSFRVTAAGVDPVPVYSPTGIYRPLTSGSGPMRVSPDKKHLVSCYWTDLEPHSALEVCDFNAETGKIEFKYLIEPYNKGKHIVGEPSDCEFSPDSKFLYVQWLNMNEYGIYQYNIKLVDDSASFYNSGIHLIKNSAECLQLSNDGRIYFTYQTDSAQWDFQDDYLGVINKPWEMGAACDVDTFGIYLGGRERTHFLPNIVLDFLYRFEWEAEDYCQGSPVHFIPHFIPTPDSIRWFFDEFAPGSISYELAPTYIFTNPGIHEVSVDIWYPTGRFEHTSREIEIFPTPYPDLGPDTLICLGSSITLNANCIADIYSWSTGQFGSSSITVSDTGTYWSRAMFTETGCAGYDTIHIGFHPPTILDESSLIITPTTCNQASGSITGLTALGSSPFAFQWLDLSRNPYGTNLDATGLPAGQYVLTIIDGNGCETSSPIYTITDAGDLQVTQVHTSSPHCFQPDGQLIISAFSPSGLPLLYSIDNGNSYQTDSVFNGLFGADYVVRVADENGCNGFYQDNPVILADIPGPQVVEVNVTDETDFLGNGIIEIIANGSTPVIYYSLDGGTTYQSNNGTFNDLGSGIYNLLVWDENGCDTTFTVEIQNIILTYLHAITGPGGHCLGNSALVPVNVDNFNSVANFHLKLSYNADNLQCEGFTNVHPEFLDSLTGWVDPLAGDIHLAWNSPTSVSFPETEKVADLVFTTKNPGQGELAWYIGETESYFTNSSGNPIPAEFQTGEVKIYSPPEIYTAALKNTCEGQEVFFTSFADGNQPPFEYLWTYPDGHQDESDPFFFAVTSANAGEYIIEVTDVVGCKDQVLVHLIVNENPVASFHGTDTMEMHAGDILEAGSGLAFYRWSTGDSTESIIINTEGMYKVEMESPIGCLGADSVYIKLVSEEIPDFDIYIPNAFSPNGDGINDIFQIKFPNSTFNLQHSTLSIFNRWGEEIFQSEGINQGWDGKKNGKDCPGGVYVYKIVFEVDGVAGSQERVGVLMLVR